MPRVGVGVPTRNRSELLGEALVCLRDQTERDFEVLVLDNASTDATPDVFRDIVGDDPRFRYRRQDDAVPALTNFHDALHGVSAEYFLWRADDDLSAQNYLERLADCLDANETADLAVSPLKRWLAETGETQTVPLPEFPAGDAVDRAVFLLRNKKPTWIYGLWRRSALLRNMERIGDRYPFAWASDHLQLMPSVLAGRVAAQHDTWFLQRILGPGFYQLDTSERLAARAAYAEICRDLLQDIDIPEHRLAEVHQALEFHLDARVGPLRRLKRRLIKERILAVLGLRRH